MSEAMLYSPALAADDAILDGGPSVVQTVADFSAKRTVGECILYCLQTVGPQNMGQLQRHFPASPKTSVYAEAWRLKKIGVINKGDDGRFTLGDLSKLPPSSFTGSAWQTRKRRMAQAKQYVSQKNRRGPYKSRAATIDNAIEKSQDITQHVAAPGNGTENVASLLTEVLNDAIALGVKIQRLHTATQTQGDTRFVTNLLSRLGN